MVTINIPYRNDRILAISVVDGATPVDITGWTLYFTIKTDPC